MATLTVTPDTVDPLEVFLDVTDVQTAAPGAITYRQQLPLPVTEWDADPDDVAGGLTGIAVRLVGDYSNTYRIAALIFDDTGLAEAPIAMYTPALPPGYVGWPTDADLASRLGLTGGDDTERVTNANQAAIADAVAVAELDPVGGAEDAGQFEAVLLLGQWWYENRNRPEGLDSLNPVASPYYRRVAIGILQRGRIPVA